VNPWASNEAVGPAAVAAEAAGRIRSMTAKEKLLERAPGWSERQAEAAIEAAQRLERRGTADRWDELAGRAAALRGRQREPSDAVALVREGRDELERRQRRR
jgi:hypothetical protein